MIRDSSREDQLLHDLELHKRVVGVYPGAIWREDIGAYLVHISDALSGRDISFMPAKYAAAEPGSLNLGETFGERRLVVMYAGHRRSGSLMPIEVTAYSLSHHALFAQIVRDVVVGPMPTATLVLQSAAPAESEHT